MYELGLPAAAYFCVVQSQPCGMNGRKPDHLLNLSEDTDISFSYEDTNCSAWLLRVFKFLSCVARVKE